MSDQTIQHTEKVVGANHPTLPDTLNRLTLVEHDPEGKHAQLSKITDPWIDVRKYGTIAAAVAAIGSVNKRRLVITDTQTLGANFTCTDNITINIPPQGLIVANGYTFHTDGPLEIGLHQGFFGFSAGDVTFGAGTVDRVYPEWWGVDGTADDVEIQSAIDSLTIGEVILTKSAYNTTSTINLKQGISLKGASTPRYQANTNSVNIIPSSAISTAVKTDANIRAWNIESIYIDMSSMPSSAKGLHIDQSWEGEARDLVIVNPPASGIGVHLQAGATTGCYLNRFKRVYVNGDGTNGTGWKLEGASAKRITATTFEICGGNNLNIGWDFDNSGSGIVLISSQAESNVSHGMIVRETSYPVKFIGGEISSNGGWGITGTNPVAALPSRVQLDNPAFSTNASGNVDIANLHVITSSGGVTSFNMVDEQTVIASDTIRARIGLNVLTAASPITMTSNPQIESGFGIFSPQMLILSGTSDTNTVTIVDGQGLRLNGNMVLGLSDTLTLVYNSVSTDWEETSRSDN